MKIHNLRLQVHSTQTIDAFLIHTGSKRKTLVSEIDWEAFFKILIYKLFYQIIWDIDTAGYTREKLLFNFNIKKFYTKSALFLHHNNTLCGLHVI